MLQSLHIKNYALIESLDITFRRGFSVITGETGAGKSIILGAVGLLLGDRSDSRTIKSGAQRCVIEAVFDLSGFQISNFFETNGLDFDGVECILRRELTDNGKSRAFINDTPVAVSVLKELGSQLVDIHSQHQNLLLNNKKFQLNILDTMANDKALAGQYRSLYISLQEATARLRKFEEDLGRKQEASDYIAFQQKELESAHLQSGEQEELEEEAQMLNNAESIKENLFNVDHLLSEEENGVSARLGQSTHLLENLSRVYPKVGSLAERLDSAAIEINDIAQEISTLLDNVSFDPERQGFVNDRLDALNSLQSKYHKQNTDELIQFLEQLRGETKMLDDSSGTLEKMRSECAGLQKDAQQLADRLSAERKKITASVEQSIQERLHSLGMPNVRFQIRLQPLPRLASDGQDDVVFLFSANKETPLQDIATVGSGGEIARVMLSLKALLSSDQQMRTMIFDEIDTGVSGRIAEKMALMMKEISRNGHQVISITHLPQIAAQGEFHYLVYKEDTSNATKTHIRELDSGERVTEIAHMLSGENLTQAAIDNAKALLK